MKFKILFIKAVGSKIIILGHLKKYPGLSSARALIFPSALTFFYFWIKENVWHTKSRSWSLWKRKHGKTNPIIFDNIYVRLKNFGTLHCLDDDIGTVTRTLFESLDYCVTPDMTSKKKKRRPPSLNFGKFLMINWDIFLSGLMVI